MQREARRCLLRSMRGRGAAGGGGRYPPISGSVNLSTWTAIIPSVPTTNR